MGNGEIFARVCITILIALSALIATIAAGSALRKWHKFNSASAAYTELAPIEDAERAALVSRNATAQEFEQLSAQHTARREARGLKMLTFTDIDIKLGAGDGTGFQAPGEVAWGLIALASATAASIWDIWLGV